MKRKNYVAPSAEMIMLMPTEEIAFSWNWGSYKQTSPASVTGTVNIFGDTGDSWIYNGSDKPY